MASASHGLEQLIAQVRPSNTVLLLGAGASVPSGAPTGAGLAQFLCRELSGPSGIESDDLSEASGILEARFGRRALAEAVRNKLSDLKPSGELVAMAGFPWASVYTTNFDRLVELAYRDAAKELTVIRSNHDWDRVPQAGEPCLFKLHGCMTKDISFGDAARMVLTEEDYEDYASYREALFAKLQLDLMTKDVLIIGQSLKDRHLRDLIKNIMSIKAERGAPGHVFALVYEPDEIRAEVLQRSGIRVAGGNLDELVYGLDATGKADAEVEPVLANRLIDKPALRVAALDVDQAVNRDSDAVRMFNGRAATYADVRAGLTFKRDATERLVTGLVQHDPFVVITGAGGVGKTTLARQVVSALHEQGFDAWEHVPSFALDADAWADVEARLTEKDRNGVLFIDDCTTELRQVNRLAERLAKLDAPRLRLVMTATTAQWRPRMKNRALFQRGITQTLSLLTRDEIGSLVALVNENHELEALVDREFSRLAPAAQIRRLRDRAQQDMFVCLKNVFGAEELDQILLTEFADLDGDRQSVYRMVSGLQALGARVHRQLVLRLLNARGDEVLGMLEGLAGVVDEYVIDTREGLYAWETRHQVIALTLAKYKYSEQGDLIGLLDRLIDDLNPSVKIELRTVSEMCNAEFGIATVADEREQLRLYERLVLLTPHERVPRHRMVRKLLDLGDLDRAGSELRRAVDAVGNDRPLNRYRVRLELKKAEMTPGILQEDRLAMVRAAERIALEGLRRFKDDKFAYAAYADVGLAVARFNDGDLSVIDDAIAKLEEAAVSLLDPVLEEMRTRFTRERRVLAAGR